MTIQRRSTCGDLVVLPKSDSADDKNLEMRRFRKHRVLNLIRESELTSRAEISRVTGYNLPNVSSIVEELVRDGLVTESEAIETPRGRRPVPISLNKNAAMVMGIELGRCSTVAILMNLRGEILDRVEMKSPDLTRKSAQARWASHIAEQLLSNGDGANPSLAGIGVAIPGLVRTLEGVDHDHRSTGPLIREELSAQFGVPVLVENDARMMALGSMWFGHGRRFSSFVMLTISRGLGCGIVMNKRICRGAVGAAGEIGHMPIGEQGVECHCGGSSCLENSASGWGLMRLAAKHGLELRDLEQLEDLGRQGDPAAVAVWDEFGAALARGISVVTTLLNPQAVVLSGKGAEVADLYLAQVQDLVRKHSLPSLMDPPEILISELGENTGSLGAGAAVLHHIFNVSHLQLEEVF